MMQPPISVAPHPVLFRGLPLQAAKRFRKGTHRACPPEETLERILPCFKTVGVTRLANITGLDRIGFPVVLSVRPNAATLATDAGKGFTLVAAKVSAAMESIERWCAEELRLPTFRATFLEVESAHPCIPFPAIPRLKHSPFHERWPIDWSFGWDLLSQAEVAVPADLVPLLAQIRRPGGGLLQQGSNGLASGNHFLEALTAALLEVIERDAVTCNKLAARLGRSIPKVRIETIEHPMVLQFLALLERAGVKPVILDCSHDLDVPVYMVDLCDGTSPHAGIFRGYGAHLDPEIAMLRALTEAAQSRLIYIAGSRDDFYKDDMVALRRGGGDDVVQGILAIPETTDARQRSSQATDTFEGDVGLLLDKLRQAGFGQVIAFDLTPPEFPVAVLRVIVPGLEGYMFDYYTPGPRACAFLREVSP
jgi:ribosomal protein S12 methylthiotransferase accessory factor